MMPARLTGGLLVRKGEARPSGGFDGPLPVGSKLARPAARRAPLAELVVAARSPMPTTTGSGRSDRDDPVKLTVRIDRTLHTRLRVLAACQRRTNQDIVQGALEAYLNVFVAGCACAEDPRPKG